MNLFESRLATLISAVFVGLILTLPLLITQLISIFIGYTLRKNTKDDVLISVSAVIGLIIASCLMWLFIWPSPPAELTPHVIFSTPVIFIAGITIHDFEDLL